MSLEILLEAALFVERQTQGNLHSTFHSQSCPQRLLPPGLHQIKCQIDKFELI